MEKQISLKVRLDAAGNRIDEDEWEDLSGKYLVLDVTVGSADEDGYKEVTKVESAEYGKTFNLAGESFKEEFNAMQEFIKEIAGVPVYLESVREWAY